MQLLNTVAARTVLVSLAVADALVFMAVLVPSH